MALVLEYSPLPPPSPWPRRCRAAMASCIPSSAAVISVGVLSTAAMRWFQAREGRTVLQGPPNGEYYEAWVGGVPYLVLAGLLVAVWCRTAWRAGRGDRLPVAFLAALPTLCLWCVGMLWIIRNGEIAFP